MRQPFQESRPKPVLSLRSRRPRLQMGNYPSKLSRLLEKWEISTDGTASAALALELRKSWSLRMMERQGGGASRCCRKTRSYERVAEGPRDFRADTVRLPRVRESAPRVKLPRRLGGALHESSGPPASFKGNI